MSRKSYGALKFATAVFFEMSKGLVIIYVEKGGGERGGGGEGGKKKRKICLEDQNPFLPGHVNGM